MVHRFPAGSLQTANEISSSVKLEIIVNSLMAMLAPRCQMKEVTE